MIIGCKVATTEYGAETFFQSQLVIVYSFLINIITQCPPTMLIISDGKKASRSKEYQREWHQKWAVTWKLQCML